jgi:ABC-2 type transport system permease protein
VTAALRVFFVGGRISYRALFNWISPGMYVTTMLGSPLFQILFFTYLGRYAGAEDDNFFIVGNAVQVSAMAGIYGMVMGIANERQYGTLSALLATPANRLAVFAGRGCPSSSTGSRCRRSASSPRGRCSTSARTRRSCRRWPPSSR